MKKKNKKSGSSVWYIFDCASIVNSFSYALIFDFEATGCSDDEAQKQGKRTTVAKYQQQHTKTTNSCWKTPFYYANALMRFLAALDFTTVQ